jgi:hypothetical protein
MDCRIVVVGSHGPYPPQVPLNAVVVPDAGRPMPGILALDNACENVFERCLSAADRVKSIDKFSKLSQSRTANIRGIRARSR